MSLESGFTTTIDLIEYGPTDSGFGTVSKGETTVASAVSARFTLLEGMKEDHKQGRGAKHVWKVIAHVDLIQDRLLAQTGADFAIKDTTTEIKYRVLKVKSQQDEQGNLHHVSLVVQQEGAAS